MEEKKLTKKDKLNLLKDIVLNSNDENVEVLTEFIENEVAAIERTAAKAKERTAAKKAEGDDLRARVKDVLTEDYQTVDEIFVQVEAKEDEELSKAKIIARLTQLVNNGDAEKTDVKAGDKKVKGYKLAK